MKDIYSIIKSPVITEKATMLMAAANRVAFWVDPAANKQDIKTAVEKIFSVKVVGVNTHRVPGKTRRMGRFEGKTCRVKKKAYITLKEGDKIGIFEGV
ncbi:MAG: 50S ribosomal protein L23 [Deltaproteobacteria bacterium]|nr:50S ribosomal protein L23 [Deltaproteobacteria bacterium]